ncbi:hypothetical protein DFQ26_005299 [Actinomortierella ambigua]|nr:hypothetical protein DFQ26_005299 [Actinomortierella ambigua]
MYKALFEVAQKYQCPIKVPRHPDLLAYVANIVAAIKQELLKDTIERVAVVILAPVGNRFKDTSNSSTSPAVLERFVFHMGPLGATDVVHEQSLQQQQQQQQQQQYPSSAAKGKQRARDDEDDDIGAFDQNMQLPRADMYTVTKKKEPTAFGRPGPPVIVVGHRTVEANEATATKMRAMLLRISAYCTFSVVIETREETTGLDNSVNTAASK